MSTSTTPPVGTLITSRATVSPWERVADVADRFFAEAGLEALVLVDGGRPVGLATRNKTLYFLSRRFGFELFGRDPISAIADSSPLIVADRDTLDRVLELAMQRSFQDVYDEVVVVDRAGRFYGILSVKRLVIEQGNVLARNILQREVAETRSREMQKVNEVKSQFIAHVTHELRSPVNAIIGLTELLSLAQARGRQQDIREKLALINASAVSLRAIITNILDLSKIEAGRMEVHPAPFDLAELVREVAATGEALVGPKPVTIEVIAPPDLGINSDTVKVRQVLVNLVSNAVKFTEEGTVQLRLEANDTGGATVAVQDTGVGIRDEDLEKLFTAFSQLENTATRQHEGTGLGLAITRQLVGLLEGRITVTSQFGRGSTFTLQLPAAIPQQERASNQ